MKTSTALLSILVLAAGGCTFLKNGYSPAPARLTMQEEYEKRGKYEIQIDDVLCVHKLRENPNCWIISTRIQTPEKVKWYVVELQQQPHLELKVVSDCSQDKLPWIEIGWVKNGLEREVKVRNFVYHVHSIGGEENHLHSTQLVLGK